MEIFYSTILGGAHKPVRSDMESFLSVFTLHCMLQFQLCVIFSMCFSVCCMHVWEDAVGWLWVLPGNIIM